MIERLNDYNATQKSDVMVDSLIFSSFRVASCVI